MPRAIHAFGADEALIRLQMLIEETPSVALDELQIDVVAPDVITDHAGILARLSRPNAQFLISRINRP